MESNSRELVVNRLEQVDMIFELRHHYCDIRLIKYVGKNGWTHPWKYFDALMYYLLLTCFDVLGQPSEWVSFSEWLASGKKAEEREVVVNSIQSSLPPIEITRHFNSKYQEIYGVKTSFNNFILKILTDEERTDLYSNIQIVRGRMDGDPNISYPALGYINEEKKLDFLFNLRNKFTHSAVIMGSPNAGVSSQAYDAIIINGKPKKGYVEIYRETKNGEWLIYYVRDWPFLLKRLVEAALARYEASLS